MDVNRNPFWLLGVSLDDDTETVEQRIEELEDDEPDRDWHWVADRLRKPLDRIRCEVAWLPGLDAGKAQRAVRASIEGEQVAVSRTTALSDLNLRIMRLMASRQQESLAEQLFAIADRWERVDATTVAQQINAHRNRAGIRAKATDDRVRTALEQHHAWMNATAWRELVRLPTEEMVATMLALSQRATGEGRRRAPEAVRNWIKKYEGECERRFVGQKADLEALTKNALAALKRAEAKKAKNITEQFCEALKIWDSVAQPIQLMYQGEGTTDPETKSMFEMARRFGLNLHNTYDETELAALVVATMLHVFKEADRQFQQLEQDEKVLTLMFLERLEFLREKGAHKAIANEIRSNPLLIRHVNKIRREEGLGVVVRTKRVDQTLVQKVGRRASPRLKLIIGFFYRFAGILFRRFWVGVIVVALVVLTASFALYTLIDTIIGEEGLTVSAPALVR